MSKYVVVITGASSGFGALSARAISKAGHTVYAGMRDIGGQDANAAKEAEKFAREEGADLRPVGMDILSQASVDAAIGRIVAETGRLDVVIHNAGHMVFGPSEAFTPEQFAELYDVNVLGTQRVNRTVLPLCARRVRGLFSGSAARVRAAAPLLISDRTLRLRLPWIPSP